MNKTLIALSIAVAAATSSPALAGSATAKKSFTHEGVTYVYTKTKVGDSTIYKGRATPGHDFYLVANGSRVVGKANGIPVSFDKPTMQIEIALGAPVQLASR